MCGSSLHQLFQDQFGNYHDLPAPVAPQLRPLPGIQCVVFDVYGTLVSSGAGDISFVEKIDRNSELIQLLSRSDFPWEIRSDSMDWFADYLKSIDDWHAYSKSQGNQFPEIDILKIWENLFGFWIQEKVIQWEKFKDQKDWIARFAVEFELKINPVSEMPGAISALKKIQEFQLPLGIVSNAQFYTPLMLEALTGSSLTGLGFDPSICIWSYQEQIAKPDRRLYEKLKKALQNNFHLEPVQVLYIGNDVKKDIVPAMEVGFKTGLFAGDPISLRTYPEDSSCRQAIPHIVLTHWDQLPALIS